MEFRKVAAASLVAGGLLLVSACGSDSSGGGDKIKGAQKSSPSSDSSGAGSGEELDLSLPKDLDVQFNWDKPGDSSSAQATAAAEKYVTSMRHAVTKQDRNDPAYRALSAGQARKYADGVIKDQIEGGWTLTGLDRYYHLSTTPARLTGSDGSPKQSVDVQFCRDQSKFFGKSVKTGKKRIDKPSLKSFQHFDISMVKSDGGGEKWKAQRIEVLGESRQCQQA